MIELTTQDRLDIIQLQSIYAWGIDGRDGSLFPQVFTDDIVVHYPAGVVLEGLELLTTYMDVFHKPMDSTHHFISNHWLMPGEDAVTMRSYVTLTMSSKGHPNGDCCSGGGWYVDRVIPTPDGWRIARRDTTNAWRDGNQDIIMLGRDAVAGLLTS